MMKRNNLSIRLRPRDARRGVLMGEYDDGRAESRILAAGTAVIGYCRGEAIDFEEASLVDFSTDGISIALRRPMHGGHCFLLRLRTEPANFAAYHVRHCYRVAASDEYRIGGELFGTIGPPDAPDFDVMRVLANTHPAALNPMDGPPPRS